MPKICDNKSVGMIVWKERKLLMIERKKHNPGFAIPAGHQDGDDPETAARRELSEEVGLVAETLLEKCARTLPNTCPREGGTYHLWTIFEVAKWHGDIKASPTETKRYLWADRDEILEFARQLEDYALRHEVELIVDNLPEIVEITNLDQTWQENPGLEPPMYFLFKELGII